MGESNLPLPPIKVLETTLRVFFNTEKNASILLDVLFHRGVVSLRLLDYLCTNYSRLHTCSYPRQGKNVHVYLSYKSMLSNYSKKLFDPFCRRERITLEVHDDRTKKMQSIVTTMGQLNFFRWCIQQGVYDYAKTHKEEIEDEMNNTLITRSSKRALPAKIPSYKHGGFVTKFQ